MRTTGMWNPMGLGEERVYQRGRYSNRKLNEVYKNRGLWLKLIKEKDLMKCSQCGYDKCFAAIDFHHKDPSKKKFAISSLMNFYPSEGAVAELGKCIPLCKNCHAELHHERGPDLRNSAVRHIKSQE